MTGLPSRQLISTTKELSAWAKRAPESAVLDMLATAQSRNSMLQRCGIAVVFALAKRLNKEWDEEAMRKALEPESLSLAADNYFDALQDARRSIGKRLNVRRSEADQLESVDA